MNFLAPVIPLSIISNNVSISSSEEDKISIDWMKNRLSQVILEQEQGYSDFRISEVLMSTYKLIWDDFCSWYLEMIKPAYGDGISAMTYNATVSIFEDILKLLHPFMPFISEELWHVIKERGGKDDALVVAPWPKASDVDEMLLKEFDYFSQVVSGARNIRKENNISFKEELVLLVKENESVSSRFDGVVKKLCNLSSMERTELKVEPSYSFLVRSNEYFIPMTGEVDMVQETKKLSEELEYTKGFLKTTQKKLSNERFVNGAPEAVVIAEKNKEADALAKIKVLEEKLAAFQ